MNTLATTKIAVAVGLSTVLLGCSQNLKEPSQNYQQAVIQAAFPTVKDVSHTLFALNPENTLLQWNEQADKVLVLTWKSQSAIDQFLLPNSHSSNNPNYPIWVTLAPQVKHFCQQYLQQQPERNDQQLALRLKQYLGLDASWNYDAFVEMYVAPEDLFRPCVDPQIDDHSCVLASDQMASSVKGIEDYANFYQALYFKSFRGSGTGVPWTGLGYTYDWGNPISKQGASEYILVPGGEYQINAVIPTGQYCR
ncbi:hypothetical protein ACVFI8_20545 [Agarivorans sp. MS3-6]|uniref:hypothetical protein n=1 Tax=Agarivorans sp. TSD2052 TaxID=2937286 RepID=UPI00200E037D|nr:hypothetical protein [Agarivorans sp. TSD2052]UPW16776.1 hypothetical protein M0C34_11000 [Agarivorans sp. TSD2052]